MKINSHFKVDAKQNVIFNSSDIKLVISDLDGTLLSSDGTLSVENLKAIKELQNAGILFSIASGRHDEMCKTYINQCNINIPTISSNGALIRNPVNSKVIYKNILDMNSAIKVLDFCKDRNLDYMAYTLDNVYFTKESNRIKKFYRYNTIAINNNINPMKLSFYNNNNNNNNNNN
ncbi:HAD family hydrolase, partial [Clostridium beijerinckii]